MRITDALFPWQLFSIFKGNTVNKICQVKYSIILLITYSLPQITTIQHLSRLMKVGSKADISWYWNMCDIKLLAAKIVWVFSISQMMDSSNFLLLNEIVNLLLMNVSLQRYFSLKLLRIKTKLTKANNFSH